MKNFSSRSIEDFGFSGSEILNNSSVDESFVEQATLNMPYCLVEALVAVCAVIGNALIIIAFYRERKLRRKTNYYIISLALADLLMGLLGIPFAILFSIGIPQDCTNCLLMMSSLLSFCTISIFSMVLVSVDRFMSVLFPLKYTDSNHWVITEIIICWLLGIFIGFLPFLWHQSLPITRCFYHDVVTEGYQLFRLVFVILIPFCVLCTIYIMIYRIILYQLKHENLFKPSYCCRTESQSCIHLATRREIRVTVNVFIIILFFTICWLPLNIIKVIKIISPAIHIPDFLIALGIVLTHFNSALNPLMYAYHLKDFRHAICKLLPCLRRESSDIY